MNNFVIYKIDTEIVLASSLPSDLFLPQKRKKGGRMYYTIWILLFPRFDGVLPAHLGPTGVQVMCEDGFNAGFP